jgi:hypothetical protein
VEIPTPIAPRRQDWLRVLGELARQLGDGRIYDRDLLALSVALNAVQEAFGRRIGAGRPAQAGATTLSPGVTSSGARG